MSLDDDEPVLAGMTSIATGMRRATYVLRARIMRAAAQNPGRHAVLCCAANYNLRYELYIRILSATTTGKMNFGVGGKNTKKEK